MELKPGDIFCTRNPMALGRAINFVQKANSEDNQSKYSHAGIIIGPAGRTFESLWTIRKSYLIAYGGMEVLIGRNEHMTPELFEHGWKNVKRHEGQCYPFWRIPMHIIPFVSKMGSGKWPVCSELACKFLEAVDLVDYWRGKCPDDIADMIHKWKGWSTVYEGVY